MGPMVARQIRREQDENRILQPGGGLCPHDHGILSPSFIAKDGQCCLFLWGCGSRMSFDF